MRRSQINAALAQAKSMLETYRWALPDWAHWSADQFTEDHPLAAFLHDHQMGWDVTDFGSGQFETCGLTLFCARNGIQGDPDAVPYAEKLLFVGEGQVTPYHCHKVKMEDIINRGGGNLMVEFRHAQPSNASIVVRVDGRSTQLSEHEPLRLQPGQSVTISRGLYHRFYGEIGCGAVFCGEVSQVNDDNSDNYFWEPLGRFAKIIEDEAALHPLWNEIAR